MLLGEDEPANLDEAGGLDSPDKIGAATELLDEPLPVLLTRHGSQSNPYTSGWDSDKVSTDRDRLQARRCTVRPGTGVGLPGKCSKNI